MLKSIPETNQY